MPTSKSVLFLLASVAMQETKITYARKIYQWKFWKQKKEKWIRYKEKKEKTYTLFRTLPDQASLCCPYGIFFYENKTKALPVYMERARLLELFVY